jgi:universal stress protein A
MQHYKNILVPVDFSNASRYALENADDLAKMNKAKLTVLHVIDYIPPAYVAATIPAAFASGELIIERARDQVEELIKDVGCIECDVVIKPGKAKKTILSEAEIRKTDLIMIGSHDETMAGFTLGSVAHSIVHRASCDVMVVRKDPGL